MRTKTKENKHEKSLVTVKKRKKQANVNESHVKNRKIDETANLSENQRE